MALFLSTDLKNRILGGITDRLAGTCGTAGTATLSIYDGAQPANADAGTGVSNLLCQIVGIGWGSAGLGATAGTANLANTAGYTGTCIMTGLAGWGRLQSVGVGYNGSAATFRIDGDVGTSATSVFVINSVSFTSAGLITLLAAPILLP